MERAPHIGSILRLVEGSKDIWGSLKQLFAGSPGKEEFERIEFGKPIRIRISDKKGHTWNAYIGYDPQTNQLCYPLIMPKSAHKYEPDPDIDGFVVIGSRPGSSGTMVVPYELDERGPRPEQFGNSDENNFQILIPTLGM